MAEDSIPSGSRNSMLTSFAGAMRRVGMSDGSIVAALLYENDNRCESPIPESEVEQIVRSIKRYVPTDDRGIVRRK